MNLSAGSRLGPYEIVAPIGAGGMGEVIRFWILDFGFEMKIAAGSRLGAYEISAFASPPGVHDGDILST